ncbi:hypothetical protein E4T47_01755 [Aureobasidium subglaciale]|nr:hypothetical protein E4T43_06534 [Aureobasidium subglaciale]KAI5275215.1 hypothetical protein E4T47_01755 [Aureobasidium subglaciale]
MLVQKDETDSGYVSLNGKSLICPQCGKAFKNKAEENRPFKCQVKNCTNTKGFATSNDLERHQKDIHLIRPKHGPQNYYRCVLPTCSKRDKIWSRKDNFKAHITRMHKNMGIDIDHLIARSEMTPSPAEMEQLRRAKCAQASNKSKGKQRTTKQMTTPQHSEIVSEGDTGELAIPLWQTNVSDYMDDMPQEAAEMTRPEYRRGRVASMNVSNVVPRFSNGQPLTQYGYGVVGGRHNSVEGAWDEVSDTSFAYSHESSGFGGGTSDFG